MPWIKKGLIYTASGEYDWNKTHAQVPVVQLVNHERLRIYFATRNVNNQSNTTYIEVAADNPKKILYQHNAPVLAFGKLGTFDDSGIMPSSVVAYNDKTYLYYVGWTTRKTVPYHNGVGLAISSDGGRTFSTKYAGPVITVNAKEPYFSGTSYVLREGNSWRMWYLSCFKWEIMDGHPEPFYHIKYAESSNGIYWDQRGLVSVDVREKEGGLVSASVIKDGDTYKMWYGHRGESDYRMNSLNSYRIGYAESHDGRTWTRLDHQSGISLSDSGWDSEMISYPCVVEIHGTLFMFYNGNGFGKSGFGYAVWE